jgi:thiol-disulfide isomerase/thioredoxin
VGEKVILLDFVTYSCINCQRTFPHLIEWQERYGDYGFVTVGVHTPEFAFEHDIENVREAAARFGLKFPIALDNEYATWQAYGNRNWPHKYLIDIHGNVVFDVIGEGAYELTEEKIRAALDERAALTGEAEPPRAATDAAAYAAPYARSEETYFGASRNGDYFGNGRGGLTGEASYAFPAGEPADNRFYLDGDWNVAEEYVEPTSPGAKLRFKFEGKGIYLVADGAGTVGVKLNGQPVTPPYSCAMEGGADSCAMPADGVEIDGPTLYRLIDSATPTGGLIELDVPEGVQLYTFTFG